MDADKLAEKLVRRSRIRHVTNVFFDVLAFLLARLFGLIALKEEGGMRSRGTSQTLEAYKRFNAVLTISRVARNPLYSTGPSSKLRLLSKLVKSSSLEELLDLELLLLSLDCERAMR